MCGFYNQPACGRSCSPRVSCRCAPGEMAMPRYTGRVADWIMNKEAPEAFTNAVTAMALLTIARLVTLPFRTHWWAVI